MTDPRLLQHHRTLALGATICIVGLALVGIGPDLADVGAFVVLGGLATLTFQIHRYGRLGRERSRRRS